MNPIPARIPAGLRPSQLHDWVRQRTVHIHRFHTSNWFPNICLQARIDLDAADGLRRKLNTEHPEPHLRITFNHMITKAAANALRNHPWFNGKYLGRDALLICPRIDAANVVDTAGIASRIVVRDAADKGLRELAAESHRLIAARRETVGEKLHDLVGIQARIPGLQQIFWAWPYLRRILRERSHANGVDFLKGNPATVVLTNPGTLGVADCKAVLFFGQLLTCLRIMAIEEEAVLDGDRLRFRKVLPVGLDYDQRLCDAPQAARLLAEFRRNLEHPESLLPGSLAPGQLRNK